MASAAAAAAGTPATEFSFFDVPQRTERIKILDITDQSKKEIYLGHKEDVEEALERVNKCPCLGRKIEMGGEIVIAYFKKDDFERNMGRLNTGLLKTIASVISSDDKVPEDEKSNITRAMSGPSLELMRLLVQVDNALQRREQTAHYQLIQSTMDEDAEDPTFQSYEHKPRVPSVKCDVEKGKTYPFKPVVRRSSSLDKPDDKILVYMYDEENPLDRPGVVLHKDCAKQMKLPEFVAFFHLCAFFSSLFFHVFCLLATFQPSYSKCAKGSQSHDHGHFSGQGYCLLFVFAHKTFIHF